MKRFKDLNEATAFAEEKASELTKILGTEVRILIQEFKPNDEVQYVVGFYKRPNRKQIMNVTGSFGNSDPMITGEMILNTNLIKQESDVAYLNESPDFDGINVGAFLEVYASAMIISGNLYEKKNTK